MVSHSTQHTHYTQQTYISDHTYAHSPSASTPLLPQQHAPLVRLLVRAEFALKIAGATAGRLAGQCFAFRNFACNARPCRLSPGFELGVSRLCASQWTRRAPAGTYRGHRGRGHMTALNAVNETRLRFASSDEGGTALKPADSSSCSHFAPMPPSDRAPFSFLTSPLPLPYATLSPIIPLSSRPPLPT